MDSPQRTRYTNFPPSSRTHPWEGEGEEREEKKGLEGIGKMREERESGGEGGGVELEG